MVLANDIKPFSSIKWKKFLDYLDTLSFSITAICAVCCIFWLADQVPANRR